LKMLKQMLVKRIGCVFDQVVDIHCMITIAPSASIVNPIPRSAPGPSSRMFFP
jgi:hypothetical protein